MRIWFRDRATADTLLVTLVVWTVMDLLLIGVGWHTGSEVWDDFWARAAYVFAVLVVIEWRSKRGAS